VSRRGGWSGESNVTWRRRHGWHPRVVVRWKAGEVPALMGCERGHLDVDLLMVLSPKLAFEIVSVFVFFQVER
jgi:hypothetical protein